MNRGETVIDYRPSGKTLAEFHASQAFVRAIMGPYGSGKSTACVIEILRRSQEQRPGPDGVRRTRWAIIRNSYPELKTTTINTWSQWVPPVYGRMTWDAPIKHHVKVGDLDMEILFLALDRPEDVAKLGSLEITGAWVNEAREVPKAIVDALTGRVGRYPSRLQGGCTWSGVLMDTNPPDDQHWWYTLAEENCPHGWQFFKQPSGRSPEAENIENLPPGYYERMMAGKEPEWIQVYVDGTYGYVIEGKPVYPMFRDSVHVSPSPLEAHPGLPILVGGDMGLTPAAIFGQRLVDGRWRILDEYTTDNCGIIRFSELVKAYAAQQWPQHALLPEPELSGFGDPAGNQRAQTDEKTAIEILREYTGWPWRPAPTNVFAMRREVVVGALNRMVDGKPGVQISPRCKTLRKGFSSGYHYRYVKSGDTSRVHDEPAKNEYSHPHDALQYLLLGGGEANVVMRRDQRQRRRASGPGKGQPIPGTGDDHKFFS